MRLLIEPYWFQMLFNGFYPVSENRRELIVMKTMNRDRFDKPRNHIYEHIDILEFKNLNDKLK
jgi:hypothetical protein